MHCFNSTHHMKGEKLRAPVNGATCPGLRCYRHSSFHSMTVTVLRTKDVVEYRSLLPILREEDLIIDTVTNNLVSFICGETGCGKSTQVPQFLFEMGYGEKDTGIIAMTQPRKLAVLNVANRISFEMGTHSRGTVSYQTRECSTVNHDTAIKIMTDGILLREIQDDFLLMKYSVVILDEVHERTSNVDILLVLLSRALVLRSRLHGEGRMKNPLRLILMSANAGIQEMAKGDLFKSLSVPVLHIQGRMFEVIPHFCRKTPDDYRSEAIKTIKKIHANLPEGDILVFLPGKSDLLFVRDRLLEEKLLRSRHPDSALGNVGRNNVSGIGPKCRSIRAQMHSFHQHCGDQHHHPLHSLCRGQWEGEAAEIRSRFQGILSFHRMDIKVFLHSKDGKGGQITEWALLSLVLLLSL